MTDRGRTLVVLTKTPRIGRGKSRLAAGVGKVSAWRINRALQAKTLRVLADPRWRLLIAIDPPRDSTRRLPGVWPERVARIGQARGDLGARIFSAMRSGGAEVAVIGTDCPAISRRAVSAVFKALRGRRASVGPAADGGFWMIAVRRARDAAPIASGVRWSHEETLFDVEARLGAVGRGPTLGDIDTVDDWRAFVRAQRSRGR